MKKKGPPTIKDKFTGASLDGWIEAGKSIPLDTWQGAKQAADAMNERVKVEEAIKESMTATFKDHEVTTENLRAQLSALDIRPTNEELEKVLSDMMGIIQTGKHTWKYQRPIDYSKWGA